MKSKFPQTVMVFGCVSSEDDIIPLHIFRWDPNLISDSYVMLLETVANTWLEATAVGKAHVYQQDLAFCYIFRNSQQWLLEDFYGFTSFNFWLLNSPDY